MDEDEENQDLINHNTTRGKGRRQMTIVSSDEENGCESDESQDEEGGFDEEDNEEEEEESDSEEDDDEGDQPSGNPGPSRGSSDLNDAHSSDDEKETCPICLNCFRDQVVGTPEHCNHYFCLDCIVEWSKNANSCPVDRITYSCIHIRAHYGGAILKRVPVQNKTGETKDDDVTNCEVCRRSDREDRLLLCDYCDAGYHMECLTPALDVIPVNEWFCPECTATYRLGEGPNGAAIEEELGDVLDNILPTSSQLRTNARHRAIARTRQSERVRSNVNRIRTRARNVQNGPSHFLSSLLDETIETVVAGLNTAVYHRNLTPRVTTRKRKRKSGKPRRRWTKRRKGRKRKTTRKVSTSHRRIARSLGLCNPTRGSSIPRVQRAPEQTIGSLRNDIGVASLSVFGTPYDLGPVDSDEDNVSNHTSSLAAKRRVLSRSALRSHQPVARPISVSLSRGGVAPLPTGSVAAAEPVPDLLGSILSGQSMLMMKSSEIVISRDGSLTAKRSGEGSSLRSSSGDELAPTNVLEPSTSHSGSSTASPTVNTWKPVEQLPQPSFPSSGLYSLSPLPSPPQTSSSSRLSMPNSSQSGMSTFRLKNAFTPRAVQVQSSVGRLNTKFAEPLPLNGTFHKQNCVGSGENSSSKKREVKHQCMPPAKRLDISEFPRIPKIKKESDDTNNESSKREESLASFSASASPPKPSVTQLTGRGESKQLGRFTASEKNTRQEPRAHSRHIGGGSSSQSSSSSGKTPVYSNSSRNVGSSDSGGGGLRITISGSSSNSCRQFSPSAKVPFRTTEDKTQQKSAPVCSTNIKKEKNVKNEMYDPFEPTGSDSGSHSCSPERPVTPPVPTSSTEITRTSPSTGVKIGAFRSFKLTTHSNKVGLCKLGPDFSGQSPSNKDSDDTKTPVNVSPVLSSFIELEKEIKKEVVIKEEKDDHADFRAACPFSGLKITSDLKSGGTRGFHFDVEDQHKISIKSEPESPHRTFHQSSTSNRLVWDTDDPSETLSLSASHSIEPQKKKTVEIIESTMCTSSRSRTHSRDRESRSPSWSMEDRERGRKNKSKSHKGKRAHNDRSSSGSCERSKKKRLKEKKRDKKNKLSDSRERKRSRSSSRSSSSLRTYNSKKKKKKKRDSKAESRGRSSSPEKEKKRKRKTDKSCNSKEGSYKTKEKKKPKDDRGKQRPKSPQMAKGYKTNKTIEKAPHFRDQEITRHIVLSPNNNDTTITCTVSFKTECPPIAQESKPKLVLPLDEGNKKEPFLYMEREVSIKKEEDIESSDPDEEIKVEIKSPPWSPSILDSLLPEHKSDNIQESPSTIGCSTLKYMPATSSVSPQASPRSTGSEPPSPKSNSPQTISLKEEPQPVAPVAVKKESDDLQWSPSHLEDFLLNELSDDDDDDVCSVEAASPDDVDLEEAILMKRENEDYAEPIVINFSKKAAIPFLQDDEHSGTEEAGNHIDQKTTKKNSLLGEGSKATVLNENEVSSMSKSKPQIKRVTWNLHHKDSEDTPQKSLSSPLQNAEQDTSWPASAKLAANQASHHEPNPSSEASGPLPWNPPNLGLQDLEAVRQGLTNAGDKLGTPALDRSLNEGSQIPWNAAETPHQVFPQTLPALPLPPIFPPYAPLNEPAVPCVIQSSRSLIGQTPKPGALASTNEPKIQAANTGVTKETKGKSKAKKAEKVDKNDEYMKKLHMQERAVEEVKLAIKPFYQKRDITKDEYKEILRKAVQKICHSKSGEINPVKVVNLVKGYVDKYKHVRNKQKKSGGLDDSDLGGGSPIC